MPGKKVGTETSLNVFSLGSSAKSNAYPPIDMVCVLLVCGPVKTQMIEEVKVMSVLPSV